MADSISVVRSPGENSFTPLGFAPSGSPSGSPSPTGAHSYSVVGVDLAAKDSLTLFRMARPGSLYPIGSGPIQATGGYYSPTEAPQSPHDASSVADKMVPLPVTSGSGGTLYRLRARDSSGPLTDPTRFVYWTSAVVSLSSYTGSLPFGGPLVELTTLDSWISGT